MFVWSFWPHCSNVVRVTFEVVALTLMTRTSQNSDESCRSVPWKTSRSESTLKFGLPVVNQPADDCPATTFNVRDPLQTIFATPLAKGHIGSRSPIWLLAWHGLAFWLTIQWYVRNSLLCCLLASHQVSDFFDYFPFDRSTNT